MKSRTLSILGICLLASSCSQSDFDSAGSNLSSLEQYAAQQTRARQRVAQNQRDSSSFRNEFFNLVRNKYTRTEFDTLVFKPDERSLLAAEFLNVDGNDDLSFDALRKQFIGIKPSTLYREGQKQDTTDVPNPRVWLEEHGVTFVSFPGIFVEFAANRPFEDVLSRSRSTAAREFSDLLDDCQSEVCFDEVYGLHGLGKRRVRLDEVVNVASYDKEDGTPLYRVVYVRPLRGSLESMGTIEEHTSDYLRRIDKYLQLTRDDNSLHLIGYSRGADAALDFLTTGRARSQEYPWTDSIRTVNFVGGALNGSRYANGFIGSRDGMPGMVNAFLDAGKTMKLRPEGGIAADLRAISWNSALWGNVVRKSVSLLKPDSSKRDDPRVVAEELPGGNGTTLTVLGMARGIIFELFDLRKPILIGDYWGNIERFKYVGSEFEETISSLTAATRARWYSTHVLPSDVVYNSLLSTMFDRTEDLQNVNPMVKNPLAYNSDSVDFSTNRRSYYDLSGLTNEEINDGAVTASEGILSSRILEHLNPSQVPIRAPLLGVLGSHHWASVMPRGMNGSWAEGGNPFPRDQVLLALATWVSRSH